jgi:hypothetical protein
VDSSDWKVGERPALAHCLVFQETGRAGGALPSLAFFGYFFEQCKKVTIVLTLNLISLYCLEQQTKLKFLSNKLISYHMKIILMLSGQVGLTKTWPITASLLFNLLEQNRMLFFQQSLHEPMNRQRRAKAYLLLYPRAAFAGD